MCPGHMGKHVCAQLYKWGGEWGGKSGRHVYMYWCMYTFLAKVWEQKWGWLGQTHSATQGHPCFYEIIQRGRSRHGKSGGHKFHVLMHVCIQNKVWEQIWDDWNTHCATQGHLWFHVTLHRGQADMGTPMDTNICTDACTHSKQGVGTEIRWLGHKHSAT